MARIKLRLTAANIPEAMDHLNKWGITVYEYIPVNEITAEFQIDVPFYEKTMNLSRYGCRIDILQDTRVSCFDILYRRWILMMGIAVILFFTLWIPTKVLFF